jgi:hypothetical protein
VGREVSEDELRRKGSDAVLKVSFSFKLPEFSKAAL